MGTLRKVLNPLLTHADFKELSSYVVQNYDTNIAKLFSHNANLVASQAAVKLMRDAALVLIKEMNAFVNFDATFESKRVHEKEQQDIEGGNDIENESIGIKVSNTPQLDLCVKNDLNSARKAIINNE